MNALDERMRARYRNDFLKEIEAQAEMGEWVKMCMQCGLCSGSCPSHFQDAWDHPPQEIFMLIRAGKRDEVLNSSAMWMCTSCYNCYTRCPRKIPVTHVMHGIAEYAHRLGRAPKGQATRHLSGTFWDNCTRTGRVNELRLTQTLYFKDGLVAGLKKLLEMQGIGFGLLKSGRLNPLEAVGAGHGCRDSAGIQAMLRKAREIEAARKGRAGEG